LTTGDVIVSVRSDDSRQLVAETRYRNTGTPPPWIRLNHSLLNDDPAFASVSPTARFVYIRLLDLSVRHRNRIPVDSLIRRQIDVRNLRRYLAELEQAGLISVIRSAVDRERSSQQEPAAFGNEPDRASTGPDRLSFSSGKFNRALTVSDLLACRVLAHGGDGREETEEPEVTEATEATNEWPYEEMPPPPASLSPAAPALRAMRQPLRRRTPEEIEYRRRSQLSSSTPEDRKMALHVADDAAHAQDAQERVELFGGKVVDSGGQEKSSETRPFSDAEGESSAEPARQEREER
jgi:hypothetical protein